MAGRNLFADIAPTKKTGRNLFEGEEIKTSKATPLPMKKTLGERVEERFGLEEGIERPSIIPVPSISPEGKADLSDWTAPEWVESLARSVELPGHVALGGDYTMGDVTESALTVGLPALRGIGGTTMKQTPSLTRQMIKEAPTAEQLKKQSQQLFSKSSGSGAVVSDEGVFNMLSGIQDRMLKSGFDPDAHPKAATALKVLGKRIGYDADFAELQQMRQFAADVAGAPDPSEARIGSIMLDQIDNHIENLSDADLIAGVAGSAEKAASDLSKARALWGRMRKREMIDEVFKKAENQASGVENGLRTGFRQILNNKKKSRGFTKSELEAMEEVVQGSFTTNTLKKLGKIGPGLGQQSNMLGAGLGAGAAYGLGGPVGAIMAPTAGVVAQKLGERGTRLAAEKARALASGARPRMVGSPQGTQGIPRSVLGATAGGELRNQNSANALGLTAEEMQQFLSEGGII